MNMSFPLMYPPQISDAQPPPTNNQHSGIDTIQIYNVHGLRTMVFTKDL